jgi:hypothetical protein
MGRVGEIIRPMATTPCCESIDGRTTKPSRALAPLRLIFSPSRTHPRPPAPASIHPGPTSTGVVTRFVCVGVPVIPQPDVEMEGLSRQRRLRKMSQEFMPAAFSFSANARVLCVGSAVVYRVALSLAGPSASSSTPSPRGNTEEGSAADPPTPTQEWVIAMSQAKFCTFLAQVHAILQHPSVRQQLSAVPSFDASTMTVDWRPFDAFLQLMGSLLDRHAHLPTWAFSSDAASLPAADDARAGLERFLADCWRALETVLPALVVEPYDAGSTASREVLCVYLLLRDLLQFPEAVLTANCAYANAILSLEEVHVAAPHVCSICLESVQRAIGRESAATVRLPCAHAFHEHCIMAWLRQSATCPQCRAPVGLHGAFGA